MALIWNVKLLFVVCNSVILSPRLWLVLHSTSSVSPCADSGHSRELCQGFEPPQCSGWLATLGRWSLVPVVWSPCRSHATGLYSGSGCLQLGGNSLTVVTWPRETTLIWSKLVFYCLSVLKLQQDHLPCTFPPQYMFEWIGGSIALYTVLRFEVLSAYKNSMNEVQWLLYTATSGFKFVWKGVEETVKLLLMKKTIILEYYSSILQCMY